jgi:hypothetical protein
MVLLCFVSKGITTVLIIWHCCALFPLETKHSDTILWEQLWYPRKQSTAIPCYESALFPRVSYLISSHGIAVLCFRGYDNCSHIMVLLCFVSEGIITVLIVWYYDSLGNKAQQYHTMRTVMIPSETKHSDTILWEQLWYLRKQSTAIPYYENSYDTLGNKAQRYHTMRTVMIPSETKNSDLCFRGYHNCSHSILLLRFVSEGIITVLIVWYRCALFPKVS